MMIIQVTCESQSNGVPCMASTIEGLEFPLLAGSVNRGICRSKMEVKGLDMPDEDAIKFLIDNSDKLMVYLMNKEKFNLRSIIIDRVHLSDVVLDRVQKVTSETDLNLEQLTALIKRDAILMTEVLK